MYKEFLEIVGNEKPTGSVKGNNCSLDTMSISVEKLIQPNPSPNSFMQKDGTEASKTRSPRGRSPSGRMFRCPCKDYFKGTSTNSFCEKMAPSRMRLLQDQEWLQIWRKCSYAQRQVEEQSSERSTKNGDKRSGVEEG